MARRVRPRGRGVFGRIAGRLDRKTGTSRGPAGAAHDDVLSDVLRTIRLSGSLQFCFMPTGAWQTDAAPSLAKLAGPTTNTIPFHIVVEGSCWLKMDGREVGSRGGRHRRLSVRHRPPARCRERRPAGHPDERPSAKTVAGDPGPALRGRAGAGAPALRLSAVRRARLPPAPERLAAAPASPHPHGQGRRLAARDHRSDRERSGQAARRRASHPGAAHRDHLHRAASAPDRRRKRPARSAGSLLWPIGRSGAASR